MVNLIEAKELVDGVYLHRYRCPEIASSVQPGQFVMIRVSESSAPLLPRPFSVAAVNSQRETFTIVFNERGEGTHLLGLKTPGHGVRVFGPLGNGFSIEDDVERHVLIAAGIGIAPLFFLLRRLHERAIAPVLVYAARCREGLFFRDELESLAGTVDYITEDGSLGHKGLATEFISDYLTKGNAVYTCGPPGYASRFIEMARDSSITSGQISLEQHMACGVGACLGCVIKTSQGYRRVCVDGPVFNIRNL